jgi:glutaminyl-tRNA synthetase
MGEGPGVRALRPSRDPAIAGEAPVPTGSPSPLMQNRPDPIRFVGLPNEPPNSTPSAVNTTPSRTAAAPAAAEKHGAPPRLDFIRAIVADDLRTGKHAGIVTRFPPEPNGYMHVGHAKSVVLNFGIAQETGGRCHLRFDDTNPETEDEHYVHAFVEDVKWLGYDWGEHLYFASDYFEEMYAFAEHLIREGKAYVDSQSEAEIRENRGTVTEPGRPSRFRDRPVEENLDLFRRMRAGEFPDGAHVLRARIDMAAPNMLMRDPLLYRIRHANHYRTGDAWCIYPMYDFAHPIEDALECITHSFCTLEFENNRPFYDWTVENVPTPCRPRQIEFARLALDYTITSKRKLLELVRGGYVSGWDDPRMPTVAGMRRRGVPPEAIRRFCEMVGVAKTNSRVDIGKLEYAIRDDLNPRAPRVLCVLNPLRVVITSFPNGETETFDAPSFPHDVPAEGSRPVPFTRELYIDRDDFMEDPPRGFHRLSPGGHVRLRHAYIIRCEEVVKDDAGEVVELRCTYDSATRGGKAPEGTVVKGTIQWVSAKHGIPCEVRLYDRLFDVPDPDAGEGDFKDHLNPDSLVTVRGAVIEPSARDHEPGTRYQFERLGYFTSDAVDSKPHALVFNRTVTLRDTWARPARGAAPEPPKARAPQKRGEDGAPRSRASAPPEARTPELEARRRRYPEQMGLAADEADLLTRDLETSNFFEAALSEHAAAKTVAKWVIHELPRVQGGRSLANLPLTGRGFGELVAMVEAGTLSGSAGREVLADMVETGDAPADIVERRGLRQVSDPDALAPAVEAVVAENPEKAAEYRGGRAGLMGFFVGQVMRRTGGRANPERVKELLEQRLAAGD